MKQNIIDIESKQLICDAQQNLDRSTNEQFAVGHLNVIADKCVQVVGKLKALFGLKYAA